MGFDEVGFKRGSHLVMMHPELGRFEVPYGTPPNIVVDNARRKEKLANNKGEVVLDWIQQHLGIMDNEEKIVEGNLSEWISLARDNIGGEIATTKLNALLENVRRNPRIEVKRRAVSGGSANVNKPGQYVIRGRFWIAPDEQNHSAVFTGSKTGSHPRKVDLQVAQQMLDQGKSCAEIAKHFSVSSAAIYQYTYKKMLKLPATKFKHQRGKSVVNLDEAQQMMLAGKTNREIAEHFTVSSEAIRRHVSLGHLSRVAAPNGISPGVQHVQDETTTETETPPRATIGGPPLEVKERAFSDRMATQTEDTMTNEGITALAAYLKMKDRAENAEAKVQLIEGELAELRAHLVRVCELDRQLREEHDKMAEQLDSVDQLL